ncbi:MAG TPA: peptidylprolyl isomerase [Gordonia sp. (in: high G+C Gram-positive bacteria)]|uniref:peptidylprolyl isomerase n=1 Tax=unclassified Gordonia (in: high G+C Gram-positive bacteria) TaxID=2657482 RepID=UPI0025C0E5AF|nr:MULTISPECIES: peptidylprolyl isomerase [unclassified Gordonia (in: high G+C Gram-positive bacteria)]HNP57746.1 peptidylprolyl isomerase [Gordonia sp. (in: high G+C Gram-positive bacteria)]HRC50436.1 peptidylprolyl isomerase [Gordonia sp. (in: high G+C Gram-positive bacteria)]
MTSNDEQVTSNEDRRLAAKRKLEARLAAERARQVRSRNILIGVLSVITLLVAATIVWVAQNFIGTVTCDWGKPQNTLADTVKDRAKIVGGQPPERRAEAEKYMNTLAAGVPKERTSPQPSSNVPVPFPGTKRYIKTGSWFASSTTPMTLDTNHGSLPITLDHASAPCNSAAIQSLASHGYYDGTDCHRLTRSENLKVLQCGDPTGTGMGGPGWTTIDEPPTQLKKVPGTQDSMMGAGPVVYPRGTVAIANSNNPMMGRSNTGAAQFFIVWSDSQLSPDFAVVGKLDESGMKTLDAISKIPTEPGPDGNKDSGRPKDAVTIKSAKVG